MKKICILLTLSIFSLLSFQIKAQDPDQQISGNWVGEIQLPTTNLEIIFKVSEDETGKLSATFDVPLQGAKDLAVSETKVNGDSLFLNIKMINGSYKGKLASENKVVGTWKQNGAEFQLTLEKTEKVKELKRPQTPKEPFPYLSEEVEYLNKKSGFKIAGTLTLPKDAQNVPGVILISGSGAQDRDETIFGHKMFFVLADYLTKSGIAVLRVDDRGVGRSGGNIQDATSEDFAGDVLAGVDFLKAKTGINPAKIGLIGHSEGGLIAPMVAAKTNEIAFIILMAGPGINGEQILYEQNDLSLKAAGMPESTIDQNRKLQEALFNILKTETDPVKALDRLQRTFSGGMYPMLDDSKKEQIDTQVAGINNAWFRFFLTYDPQPTLQKVKCPVLALNGSKDVQVPATSNLAAIKKALKEGGNNEIKTIELENLNHLFQNCETGAISEYAQIEETIEPKVLGIMKNWILEVVK